MICSGWVRSRMNRFNGKMLVQTRLVQAPIPGEPRGRILVPGMSGIRVGQPEGESVPQSGHGSRDKPASVRGAMQSVGLFGRPVDSIGAPAPSQAFCPEVGGMSNLPQGSRGRSWKRTSHQRERPRWAGGTLSMGTQLCHRKVMAGMRFAAPVARACEVGSRQDHLAPGREGLRKAR
jgi:hypothetical protein